MILLIKAVRIGASTSNFNASADFLIWSLKAWRLSPQTKDQNWSQRSWLSRTKSHEVNDIVRLTSSETIYSTLMPGGVELLRPRELAK